MVSSGRTYLFVPADRPDRFGKALSAGSDHVIIDLEDAVATEEKDDARAHLVSALERGLPAPVHVRVNSVESPWFEQDIAALTALSPAAKAELSGLILPKAETVLPLQRLRVEFGDGLEIVALIESAAGLANVRPLAKSGGIDRFALGAVDLSFDIDAEVDSGTIDYAYAVLVIESRLAGLAAPIASPPLSLSDTEGTERDSRRLRSLGLTAQLCIHPAQIAPVTAGFSPTEAEARWARRVLATVGGAAQLDGQMVDKPIRDRAERILAQGVRGATPPD